MEIPYQIHVHHEKRLKDYLFDFFMLFLAVTLGFFVENTRENLSKTKRDREYIKSMIQDLKEDTAKLNLYINYNSGLLTGVDSLIKIIYQYKTGDTLLTKNMYLWYMSYGRSTYAIHFTDRTIIQLKSSGSFSTLSPEVSDSILKYEEATAGAIAQETPYKDGLAKALEFSTSIFNYKYISYNVKYGDKNAYTYLPQQNWKKWYEEFKSHVNYSHREILKQVM